MPRILQAPRQVFKIEDQISGSDIELYYREPTTKERVGYNASLRKLKGRKLVDCSMEARLTYGPQLLLGFSDGSFAVYSPSGQPTPLSSDPESPHYREDWRDLVTKAAPDLVALLAYRVFEAPALAMSDQGEENDAAADADEDLGKN